MDVRKHWLTLGERASDNLFAWAAFVAQTEFLWQDTALVQDAEAWQRLWFELEIINGLALSQWDDQGKPADWSHNWNKGYRQEAAALATELLALLCDVDSSAG
ncbi:hypothetical protein DYL59_08730 [Pseudomonas kairouanensis]|uniref:Uncharacterized protein n=1 Tax=Pseudomonas kairouanensis TaxID=2293832 RepID=A0A4Z0AV93_9PSED|nr:hypothetical protein [Pseudomonas kairouanensis]TFY90615.1 hypothetical protein DYL59_08730 [Pseudomonas kairouanensis]